MSCYDLMGLLGVPGESYRIQDPDESKGDLEVTGKWGVSFRALDVF